MDFAFATRSIAASKTYRELAPGMRASLTWPIGGGVSDFGSSK